LKAAEAIDGSAALSQLMQITGQLLSVRAALTQQLVDFVATGNREVRREGWVCNSKVMTCRFR
jgi:hypothetical protein